uniref:Gamma-aminobutyric acid type B receptor subunit 2 n=1 Tax=Dermatophagoides pteronyssinus TaxID=6956 RepID=A0A6P6Y0P3_DERPT|nr:uncharacterized protein LOC113792912 [Dermatophagoides pteronyssinus]
MTSLTSSLSPPLSPTSSFPLQEEFSISYFKSSSSSATTISTAAAATATTTTISTLPIKLPPPQPLFQQKLQQDTVAAADNDDNYHQHYSVIRNVHSYIPSSASSSYNNHRSKTLYIAGFFPTSKDIPQGAIGRGVLPAVRLALQHVNESPLFTKYRLDLVWNNTKCDAAYGMKAFFQMLDEDPVKILLFGGACPSVTDPIAKTSKFFHLIQLSYADTFTATTANFFRIVPSEGSFNPARVKLLKYFNWTKVGTIYQNLPRYSLPHSKLLTDLDNADIEIVASQSIADELKPEMYLQDLKAKDVRIIVGNFGEEYGRKIFCQAYKEGIYGRRYQWIITGIYDENWWQLNDDEIDLLGCTEEQLLEAINGYISTDILPLSKNTQTYYGFETSLYKSEYDRLRLREYSRFHGYAYDGIWTIALAIQTVDKKLRQINSPLTIEDFHYRDPFWAQLFREALNETDFIGVTDHVSFDKNERRGIVLLQQFQSKKFSMTDIAQYYTYNDELIFDDQNQIDWRGGNSPPVDRNTVVIKPSRISMTLFIVISVFAIIGIIIAFVFLAMNIKYRNQRYIKMSSPYLNNLIIIGCILTYTSVILLGLNSGLTNENNFPYICASRAWVLMTGFTLAFGSMFSKTWRVHAIFTDIKLNKKLIKDYKLFMVVGVLVFIDVVTLTTWQIVDPFFRVTSQGKPEPSPQNEDILVIPEMEYCQSKRMTIFLGSIYVYKGLLMAFGIFLAWETRHVSIPALNDSKYIGMSVYNVVIMCVIGAGVSFVLRDQQDAAFVIISAFIIFCSTATLCLVFVPKLIELKRNPNAGDRRVRATLKPFKKSHRDSEDIEIHTKIKLANEENFRLRQRLKEKSYELEALTFRLRALEESMEKEMTNVTTTSSSAAKTIIQPKIPPPSSSLSLSPTTTAGKSVILASNSVNNLGMARSSSSYANNIIPNTTNEIIVEENDLKQIDNCDQRKLSVASLKVLSKSASSSAAAAAKRQKLNIIKTPLGHFEIQEETTSTSPTEIIVNSTSILSLSSEAAQLTVKNSQQSTNEPPISSNISSNGEQNNSPQNGNDGISDQSATGSTKSSDEMSFTFPTYHPTHHHHHSKRITGNGIAGGDSNLFSPNGSFNEQCSLSNGSDETSDDTSYAKAIKQTMESQVQQAIMSSNTNVISGNNITTITDDSHPYHYHHHHHQCTAIPRMTTGMVTSTATSDDVGTTVHLQHCCHHHNHNHPHHHHVPITVHHPYLHHPTHPHHHHHHHLPISAISTQSSSSMPTSSSDYYQQQQQQQHLIVHQSQPLTPINNGDEEDDDNDDDDDDNRKELKLPTVTEISSNTTIDNDENENNNKPEMMIENNQQHCHNIDEKKNMFDNNNNNIDLGNNNNDNLKRTFQQRRTQSFGGFLPTTTTTGNIMINTHEDYKTSSSSTIVTISSSMAIDSAIRQTFKSKSPVRSYSSFDDTLNIIDSIRIPTSISISSSNNYHHHHQQQHQQQQPLFLSSSTTSLSTLSSLRLYPYLTHPIVSTTSSVSSTTTSTTTIIQTSNHHHFYTHQQQQQHQPPLHYRSMLIDQQQQQHFHNQYSSTMATTTLPHTHHHNHHNHQQHSNQINHNHLRSGQSCPHVRCDIVEYL